MVFYESGEQYTRSSEKRNPRIARSRWILLSRKPMHKENAEPTRRAQKFLTLCMSSKILFTWINFLSSLPFYGIVILTISRRIEFCRRRRGFIPIFRRGYMFRCVMFWRIAVYDDYTVIKFRRSSRFRRAGTRLWFRGRRVERHCRFCCRF